jgi:hypothetical protein
VKDIKFDQPFLLRLIGLLNSRTATSDTTHPIILIFTISVGKELRKALEERRETKRVRETYFE